MESYINAHNSKMFYNLLMKAHIEKTIGKENIETFKTKFKETLAKEQKTNEIKSLDLELKTTTTEPTGLSLEFKTFTKDEYAS